MKTPVLIAAYNEADRIGQTLHALDQATTEPFVIVNGVEGAEDTMRVAEEYTSHVYRRPEQGKLPALQYGLRQLFQYDADADKNPILFTDADTQPVIPEIWAPTLGEAVVGKQACAAAGIVFFHEGSRVDSTLRNTRRVLEALATVRGYTLKPAYGANLAINFAGDQDRIEQVLDAPHVWPAEDRYLAYLMAGDERRFSQTKWLGAAVMTSARYLRPLREKIGMHKRERLDENISHYGARQADTVTHYFDEFTQTLHKTQ